MEAPRLSVIDTATVEEIFLEAIGKIVGVGEVIKEVEPPYVARVFARYATHRKTTPRRIATIAYKKIYGASEETSDPKIFRAAGDESLFFGGFLHDHLGREGVVKFYERFGPFFYARAGELAGNDSAANVLQRMSDNFDIWIYVCRKLQENSRLGFPQVRH